MTSPIVEHLRMISFLVAFFWPLYGVDRQKLFQLMSGPINWYVAYKNKKDVLGIFISSMHKFQQQILFLPCPNPPTNPVFPGICGDSNQNMSILIFNFSLNYKIRNSLNWMMFTEFLSVFFEIVLAVISPVSLNAPKWFVSGSKSAAFVVEGRSVQTSKCLCSVKNPL